MLARRLLLFGALATTCLWLGITSVRAELERSLLDQTRALFALSPASLQREPRELVVNGARVVLATGRSDLPLGKLLDHFVSTCRRESAGLAEAARQILAEEQPVPSLADGVLRVEGEREGLVGCLALGAGPFDGAALAERLARFATRGDLAELGGLRVTRVTQHERGTFFVAVASQGAMPLWEMFPAKGDAPGLDLATLPRPEAARRIFSAYQKDAGAAFAVYEREGSPAESLARYGSELARAGYDVSSPAPDAAAVATQALFVARGGHHAVVVAQPEGSLTRLVLMALDEGPGLVSAR